MRREEASNCDEGAEAKEPVGNCVQSRESHVRRTDLNRHEYVGKPCKQWRCEHQQHDRAVHGEQLVVLLLGRNDVETRQR